MEDFDRASAEAEIRTRIKACEAALGANDVDRLVGFFWDDPRAVRLSTGGGLYGPDQIASFRKGRDVSDIARELSEMRITAFSADFGTATCEYRRLGSGRRAAQSQIRMRRPEGWPIVSAHVSLDARPAGGALSRRVCQPPAAGPPLAFANRVAERDTRAEICMGLGSSVGLGVVGRCSRFTQHIAHPV
jgi:hypothetical protein